MDDSNARLRAKLKASEAKEALVRSELADLKGHLRRQTQESEMLRGEVAKLQRMLKVQVFAHPTLSGITPRTSARLLQTTAVCGPVLESEMAHGWGCHKGFFWATNTACQEPKHSLS